MTTIAFIGLGNMGEPMARNLLTAGHNIRVFDLNPDPVTRLCAEGADTAETPAKLVNGCDVIISMLPAGKHVKGLYLDDQGLLPHIAENSLVIDCSTIDADSAKQVGEAFKAANINFVDAPVSGGVGGATAGTLTFMMGGEAEAVASAKNVLTAMGQNLFHAGATGAGQIAKMCNNMLLAVLMTGTSEALQLGIKNGLDPAVMSEIMLQSSGNNWTLQKYNPCPGVQENVPASNGYQGGFMVDLMAKDLALALDNALSCGASTPMGALARSLYAMHAGKGHGKQDFSSIFSLFDQQ